MTTDLVAGRGFIKYELLIISFFFMFSKFFIGTIKWKRKSPYIMIFSVKTNFESCELTFTKLQETWFVLSLPLPLFTGRSIPRGYPHHLPDARLVSNLISDSALGPDDQFDNIRSGEVMGFGQILAHDLIETQIPSGTHPYNQYKF